MNVIEGLVQNFQELAAHVPELIQPLVVALAAAVPFIEGEVAAMIGVVGGVNPILVFVAAVVGNFLSVLAVVLLGSRARAAMVQRRATRVGAESGATAVDVDEPADLPESKGRARFTKWLVRYGVPGASILGPLAIPTQFTSAILVAGGTPRRWVLLWQAVAILIWTTLATVSLWAALTFVVGV